MKERTIVDRRRADEDTNVETKGENCTTAKEMGGKGKDVRKRTGWEEMVFVPHHAKHAMIARKSGGLVSDPGELGGDLMLGGCHPDFRSPVTEELSDGHIREDLRWSGQGMTGPFQNKLEF